MYKKKVEDVEEQKDYEEGKEKDEEEEEAIRRRRRGTKTMKMNLKRRRKKERSRTIWNDMKKGTPVKGRARSIKKMRGKKKT